MQPEASAHRLYAPSSRCEGGCCGNLLEGVEPRAPTQPQPRKAATVYSISRIQHILQSLPRGTFQRCVQAHQADRYSKGFTCWDQLVAMVYAQLSGASSLRQLEAGFNQHPSHHYHLATGPMRRSTLADANARRNPQVFADTARILMQQAGRRIRRQRQELLYLLDSTSIALTGRGFDWTGASATRTAGLKVHILYEANSRAVVHHSITPANVNDIDEGRRMPIEAGATYVFDKGYCDYGWWRRIDAQGARFVTRFKRNAALKTCSERRLDSTDDGVILRDSIVAFAHRCSRGGHRNAYTGELRRIEVARAGDAPLVLATNDLDSPAVQVAQLYKQRWQVELFFKWIKQHLSIKRFLGQSQNAVRIQLLTALITYLLLVLYKAVQPATSLWALLMQVRAAVFQRPTTEHSDWRRRREHLAVVTALQPRLFP